MVNKEENFIYCIKCNHPGWRKDVLKVDTKWCRYTEWKGFEKVKDGYICSVCNHQHKKSIELSGVSV